MAEEHQKRLFAVTVSAQRVKEDGQPEVGLHNAVMFLLGDGSLEDSCRQYAHQAYSEDQGWRDHTWIYAEIAQGMMFGPFRLTWAVENTEVEATP